MTEFEEPHLHKLITHDYILHLLLQDNHNNIHRPDCLILMSYHMNIQKLHFLHHLAQLQVTPDKQARAVPASDAQPFSYQHNYHIADFGDVWQQLHTMFVLI